MVSVVTGTIGVIAAVSILILIRRDRLQVRYGLWWMAVAVAFAILGLFPRSIDDLADFLGVAYGPALALTLGLTAVVIKILVMDIARSRNEMQIGRLVQRIAMLEADVRRAGREPGPGSPEDREAPGGNDEAA